MTEHAETAEADGEAPREPVPKRPRASERGKMRRRLRRQREVREALLLDLGALVFELHRQGRREPELLQAKAAELSAVDSEVRALAEALDENLGLVSLAAAGISATCDECGTILAADAKFCHNCGHAAAPSLTRPDAEAQAATAAEPKLAATATPEAEAATEPEAATTPEPEAAISAEPEAATSKEPETKPAVEPEAATPPGTESAETAPESEGPAEPQPEATETAPEPGGPADPEPEAAETAPEPEGPAEPEPEAAETAPESEGPPEPEPEAEPEAEPEPEPAPDAGTESAVWEAEPEAETAGADADASDTEAEPPAPWIVDDTETDAAETGTDADGVTPSHEGEDRIEPESAGQATREFEAAPWLGEPRDDESEPDTAPWLEPADEDAADTSVDVAPATTSDDSATVDDEPAPRRRDQGRVERFLRGKRK